MEEPWLLITGDPAKADDGTGATIDELRPIMNDILLLVLLTAFFVLCAFYVRACDQL